MIETTATRGPLDFSATGKPKGCWPPIRSLALYVYHQVFDHAGHRLTRRGFMARVRLNGSAKARSSHTKKRMSGPKPDRLLLTRACQANLSQIFGLYPDDGNEAQERLERMVAGSTADRGHRSSRGGAPYVERHRSGGPSPRSRPSWGPRPIFVADGHHRYETACNYRDQLAAAVWPLDQNHPANFVLMMCVGMSDAGMVVLPTHRLFRACPAWSPPIWSPSSHRTSPPVSLAGGADLAHGIWDEIEMEGDQGTTRPLYRGRRTLDAGSDHRGWPPEDGRACPRAQHRLARPGRGDPASPGDRKPTRWQANCRSQPTSTWCDAGLSEGTKRAATPWRLW